MDTAYKTTLELDKIIARAVQLCACRETKEMMQALEPYTTPEEERYALAQTNAINTLLIQNGSRVSAACPRHAGSRRTPRRAAFFRWENCWRLLPHCAIFQAFPVVRPERA